MPHRVLPQRMKGALQQDMVSWLSEKLDTAEKLHTTTESRNAIHTKAKHGNTVGHPMVPDATKNNKKIFPNSFPPRILNLLNY